MTDHCVLLQMEIACQRTLHHHTHGPSLHSHHNSWPLYFNADWKSTEKSGCSNSDNFSTDWKSTQKSGCSNSVLTQTGKVLTDWKSTQKSGCSNSDNVNTDWKSTQKSGCSNSDNVNTHWKSTHRLEKYSKVGLFKLRQC